MCTLYTVPVSMLNPLIAQLEKDYPSNHDGCSAIGLVDQQSALDIAVLWRFQSMGFRNFVKTLRTLAKSVTRVCVHMRAATQGFPSVANCHFFDTDSGDWAYCHNGIIHDVPHRVDSLAIGPQLDNRDPGDLTQFPRHWDFANVIAANQHTGDIVVHRSRCGTLYVSPDFTAFGSRRLSPDWYEVTHKGWYYVVRGYESPNPSNTDIPPDQVLLDC